jgi:uncharacterized membrane protein
MKSMDIGQMADHGASDIAKGADALAAFLGVVAVSTAWMEWMDLALKIIIGVLTIILLIQRIVAHCRRRW